MKKLFLICLLFAVTTMFSQNKGSVKGKVLDIEMNNEPLLFAHIHIKGSDINTETNFHGNFEINNIDNGDYTLVISYIGYETVELPITIKNNTVTKINKGLKAKTISLDASLLNELNSETTYEVTATEKKLSK